MKTKIRCIHLILLTLSLVPGLASDLLEKTAVAEINSLTTDLVFISLLNPEKIQTGTVLYLTRNGITVGRLEVLHTSSNSASCKALTEISTFKVGDLAFLTRDSSQKNPEPEERPNSSVIPIPQSGKEPVSQKTPKRNSGNIRGRFAIQWYQWIDSTESGNSFIQPALRINIKGDSLTSNDYQFRVKTRMRYTDRNRPFSTGLSNTSWKNKVYNASFGRDNRDRSFGFQAGRILNRNLPNIGPIDGGLIQWNLNSRNQISAYAGLKPDWQYGSTNSDIKKYGIYFNHESGDYKSLFWSSNLALNTEYSGSFVNRDYIYLSNRIHWQHKLNFYQSAEIDFMRDWRVEHSDSTVELTNFFTFLNYTFSDRVTAGFSYDTRKTPPTHEYLTEEELYFDDLYRQGVRINLYLRLWKQSRLSMNYGVRSEEGEKDTTSYMLSFYQPRIWNALSLSLRYYGYENPFTKGSNPSLRFGWNSRKGHTFSLSFNRTDYTSIISRNDIAYDWISLQMYLSFNRKFYSSFQYEYNNSEFSSGQKIFLELGYRFR